MYICCTVQKSGKTNQNPSLSLEDNNMNWIYFVQRAGPACILKILVNINLSVKFNCKIHQSSDEWMVLDGNTTGGCVYISSDTCLNYSPILQLYLLSFLTLPPYCLVFLKFQGPPTFLWKCQEIFFRSSRWKFFVLLLCLINWSRL